MSGVEIECMVEGVTVETTSSYVSSWNLDSSKKELHLSQSSRTNLNAKTGSADCRSDQSEVQLCYGCNKRPLAVRLLVSCITTTVNINS